jgi:AcrR family transcriptional regulator
MPRAFSERERDVIRERLRQGGREAFAAYGLRASVDDLVRMAGISKGAFYLFYESKEALLLEILEGVEADLQARLLQRVLAPGLSPAESVSELLRQTLTARRADPLLRRLGPEDLQRVLRRVPPEQAEALRRADVAAVQRFLDHWRARGVLLALDAPVMAGLLRALFFAGLYEADIGAEVYPLVIEALIAGASAAIVLAVPGAPGAPQEEPSHD